MRNVKALIRDKAAGDGDKAQILIMSIDLEDNVAFRIIKEMEIMEDHVLLIS
ncbi:hypothetical protein [Chordicoccus furentiruminis]|uniref:hypothetical protein n=1 Tax=Chordicoccus furentiruminis TaxID=2709410 RepID=UPI0023A83C41|nr:hypothetical protein [Chordicoccus furentiruminis]